MASWVMCAAWGSEGGIKGPLGCISHALLEGLAELVRELRVGGVGGSDPKLVWCHTNGVGDVCCMVKGGSTQSAPSSPNKCRPRAGRIGGVGGGDG